jgi:exosome complex protein LRP1
MDSSNMDALINTLESDIDDLEASLAPLLTSPITNLSTKLPLLDKSKLYILSTYAIESLLFSYVRLNGVDARSHPVFTELARVKQYFDKIKAAENPQAEKKQQSLRLDQGAAKRFITAALSGNDKFDAEREGRNHSEREKSAGMKRKAEDGDDDDAVLVHNNTPAKSKKAKKDTKERRMYPP